MNYIGLDISKASTAMVIEANNKEYYFSYNTKDKDYIWNKLCRENNVNIRTYDYTNSIKKDYSTSEVNKLKLFSEISTTLFNDIINTINIKEDTVCFIEGYSYGKGSSQILDLVGIGSCIRAKIYEGISNVQLKILAPKSLKTDVCRVVYGSKMVETGKKKLKLIEVINPNNKGISGGNFTKIDMFDAIIESNFNSNWKDFLLVNLDKIRKVKDIPKPIEDINDAFLLKEIVKI